MFWFWFVIWFLLWFLRAQAVPIDANGDGTNDSIAVDTSGDGVVDTIAPAPAAPAVAAAAATPVLRRYTTVEAKLKDPAAMDRDFGVSVLDGQRIII